ncbi:MAG: hypothetical protein AB7U73_00410 [Pirellulales bacterium]
MRNGERGNPTIPARPWQARAALVLFATVTAFFIAITLSPWRSGFADAPDRGPGDIDLYRAEVERMRGGYGYYDAAEAELRTRGYPTRSVFNWRMPLPMWLIAQLPDVDAAKAVLGLSSLVLVWLAFRLVAEESSVGEGLLCVVLLSGALLPCILGNLLVMPELWSGLLIALSVVCFGLRFRGWGVAAGLAALFFRELAAPYVLICIGLAAYERRGRELGCWVAGLAAYGLFLVAHVSHVVPRISVTDTAHADGWICFGGAGFLISTVQMNAYLLLLPQWITAIYLSCALLGCTAWRSPAGTRIVLTVAAYCVAFSIVGHDFNQYWGSMFAPVLCLAACRFPSAIAGLVGTALAHRSGAAARLSGSAG